MALATHLPLNASRRAGKSAPLFSRRVVAYVCLFALLLLILLRTGGRRDDGVIRLPSPSPVAPPVVVLALAHRNWSAEVPTALVDAAKRHEASRLAFRSRAKRQPPPPPPPAPPPFVVSIYSRWRDKFVRADEATSMLLADTAFPWEEDCWFRVLPLSGNASRHADSLAPARKVSTTSAMESDALSGWFALASRRTSTLLRQHGAHGGGKAWVAELERAPGVDRARARRARLRGGET